MEGLFLAILEPGKDVVNLLASDSMVLHCKCFLWQMWQQLSKAKSESLSLNVALRRQIVTESHMVLWLERESSNFPLVFICQPWKPGLFPKNQNYFHWVLVRLCPSLWCFLLAVAGLHHS